MTITTPGIPAGITGTRRLVADGDGCLDTFDGEAKARIPLVGGKIENFIGNQLVELLIGEQRFTTAWIKDNP